MGTSAVVLVTGCSSGIGRATAVALAAAGWTVVATARDPARLEGLGAAMAAALDVTDARSVRAAVDGALARFGRIDALVNNAGYGLRAAVEELDPAAFAAMLDVNLLGIVRLAAAVAPGMRARGSGRIVNIGSIAGRISMPVSGAYSASKFAVEALSDSMRQELGHFGLYVSLVEPGNIRSSFKEGAERGSPALRDDASPYAGIYARYLAVTGALRATEPGPERVARAVLRALAARRPLARYRVAVPFATMVGIALPDRGKDFVMRRMVGLRSPRRP